MLYVLAIVMDFLVLLVTWGAVCALVAWILAKIRKRPVAIYFKRACWIALIVAVIGTLGLVTSRYQHPMLAAPTETRTAPASGAATTDEAALEQARGAHRALQQEVAACYSLILQWNDEAITYAQYLERSQVALRACDAAVEALREAAAPLARSEDPLIRLVLESFSIKESQVYCLQQLHKGIVQLETGAAEEGFAAIQEYDTRFAELQRRYEAIGAEMMSTAQH